MNGKKIYCACRGIIGPGRLCGLVTVGGEFCTAKLGPCEHQSLTAPDLPSVGELKEQIKLANRKIDRLSISQTEIDLLQAGLNHQELVLSAAAEIKRLRGGYNRIIDSSDSEMADGDLARKIAAEMLGVGHEE